jgi:hypothetical protein
MRIEILRALSTKKIAPKLWVVTEPFVVYVDGRILTVPKGFVTDFGSIPRYCYPISAPASGPMAEGYVVHDWLYNQQSGKGYPKEFADNVMRAIGIHCGAPKLQANSVHFAVHLFGKKHYKAIGKKPLPKTLYVFKEEQWDLLFQQN